MYILNQAVGMENPLFIHFDEIGALGDNVRDLREAVRRTWELMLKKQGEMPRIYFYLSGKSVPFLTARGEAELCCWNEMDHFGFAGGIDAW